jgi:glycopeptide antibiotics resistance protein
MKNSSKVERGRGGAQDWSNRILILAIAGILFLTLFPFRFDFHAKLPRHVSPFLLQSGMKSVGAFDDLLNVLLFVPFGFGLAAKLRQQGRSRSIALALTFAAGALTSYTVEFLQNYVPSRDSGWHDVLTNTTGSVAGFTLFMLGGKIALRPLSAGEEQLRALLTLRRAAWFVPIYFVLWCAVSIPLQEETQPINWNPGDFLVVGNLATVRHGSAWKGKVYRLELWNHAVPDEFGRRLTAGDRTEFNSSDPLAVYDFSSPGPFRDQRNFLPALSWNADAPLAPEPNAAVLKGSSWLISEVPVKDFVNDLKRTRQFAVHVICAPADTVGEDKRIVAISRGQGGTDLDIRRDETNLVFWFRNGLSARRSVLAWSIPNVFSPNQVRNILFSYDGSNLSLYVDGQKEARTLQLGPGTALARLIRNVKPSELEGYRYVYYALLFFPGGILLGVTARNPNLHGITNLLCMAAGFLLPPIFHEMILMHVTGRTVSFASIALAFCLVVAGSLWINADHWPRRDGGVER